MNKSVTGITLLAASLAALSLGVAPSAVAQDVEREAEEIERSAQREAREADRAVRREARDARREARQAARDARNGNDVREDADDAQLARAGSSPHAPVQSLGTERGAVGEYVVDDRGYALYLLEEDDDNESRCDEQCAEQWPPARIAGDARPSVDSRSLDEDEIDAFEREDGSMQLTYDDHPLYYYYRDSEPGQTTGHDIHDEWGGWYLVTPDGEKLEQDDDDRG